MQARIALLLALIAQPALAQSPPPVIFELVVEDRAYYHHEQVWVTLRFGFESQFLRRNLIQMFTRKLEIPAQLEADWIDDLPGTTAIPQGSDAASASGERRQRFILNETIARAVRVADRVIDGKTFSILELRRSFFCDRVGVLKIPAAKLRFRHAASFEQDFDGGMIPISPRQSERHTQARHLTVRAVPTKGQPLNFNGAVGTFNLSASATPLTLDAGTALTLSLQITGKGNLNQVTPPALSELEGLHLLGKTEVEDLPWGQRRIEYDLVPVDAGVREIPAIRLAYFDPTPPTQYRTASTKPIPIRVRRTAPLESDKASPPSTPGLDDVYDLKAATPHHDDSPWAKSIPTSPLWRSLLLLLPWFLSGSLWFLHRRISQRRAPEARQARSAVASFHACLDSGDSMQGLVNYLATRMQCKPAAVVTPDLAARLRACGPSAQLAEQTAKIIEDLIAAEYGGEPGPSDRDRLTALVTELEASFRRT